MVHNAGTGTHGWDRREQRNGRTAYNENAITVGHQLSIDTVRTANVFHSFCVLQGPCVIGEPRTGSTEIPRLALGARECSPKTAECNAPNCADTEYAGVLPPLP